MRDGLRLSFALIATVLSAALLAACGDLESDGGGDPSRGELTAGVTISADEPRPQLPTPQFGQVLVDGQLTGSLTTQLTDAFRGSATRNGLAVSVAATQSDESEAFAGLCEGRLDVVDASRRITDEEAGACAGNGLEVVDFQIAFDATVIVTRNERDVGADCVNFDQLRTMFEAGTPVTAWNQVNPNFFPIQLTTTGPAADATDFRFFGQRVLGVPDPTLASFRSDYAPYQTEREIKNRVAGGKDEPGGAPPGRVGIIGFSFYELFEDKLRPLEIDGQSGDRCVFPSEETISSELYPLERTLRLYTTQRSLNRQEVQSYLRYYLKQSEQLANDNELIPISDAVRRQEIARIDDPLAYGDSSTGETSEPSPTGTVDPTAASSAPPLSTSTVPGTPSGSGTETASSTTAADDSLPPATTTGSTTSSETVPSGG